MINKLQKQGGRCSFRLSVMLLLMAALLILAIPAISGAEETVTPSAAAAESLPAPSAAETALCSHIKPFKDTDEFMYQLYLTLEDDCLLKMDPRELSRIWGIPTLEIIDNRKPMEDSYLKEVREPLPGDHAHLMLRITYIPDYPYISGFSIRRVNTNDDDNYPFFPDNEYPKLLPEPLLCYMNHRGRPTPPHRRGKYIGSEVYAWFNSDKSRMLYLRSLGGIVHNIIMTNHVLPYFGYNCKYERDW